MTENVANHSVLFQLVLILLHINNTIKSIYFKIINSLELGLIKNFKQRFKGKL